jgi:hypothetical protein
MARKKSKVESNDESESPRPIARLDPRRSPRPAPLLGSLGADHNGFSLTAKVPVPAGELERLEHLCRYNARPPIATQRLAFPPNGRVVYGLNRHCQNGTSAVPFDPLTSRATRRSRPADAGRDFIVTKRAPPRDAHSHAVYAPTRVTTNLGRNGKP